MRTKAASATLLAWERHPESKLMHTTKVYVYLSPDEPKWFTLLLPPNRLSFHPAFKTHELLMCQDTIF